MSGEIFESFGSEKVQNSAAKSNLSAEHIVPLCQGGDDIFPNLVPSVLQYNVSKNGYNLLDWWTKQKDNEGKPLYSPYRLIKIVNYMLKSEQLRKEYGQEIDKKTYKKGILTPHEIDEFLKIIEQQDEIEEDNSKRKIKSSVITSTETKDGKKFLTQIPTMEGNIPKQNEQQREKNDDKIMDIFLYDSINMLKEDNELGQHKKFKQLMNCLEDMYKKTRGVIPFEIEVRNKILNKIEELGVKENKYTVANVLLQNTEILKVATQNSDGTDEYISQYFEEREKN